MSLLRASIFFAILSGAAPGCLSSRKTERPPLAPPHAREPVQIADVADGAATAALEEKEAPARPLMVVRGVLEPVATDSNMTSCLPMLGARHGTPPIALHLERPKTVYVFAKARGPIGLATGAGGQRCAVGGADEWVKLVVPYEYEDVTIDIADVDVVGERRGQTSPYVVVVSEQDEEPALEPGPRAPVGASDLAVRWAVKRRLARPKSVTSSASTRRSRSRTRREAS